MFSVPSFACWEFFFIILKSRKNLFSGKFLFDFEENSTNSCFFSVIDKTTLIRNFLTHFRVELNREKDSFWRIFHFFRRWKTSKFDKNWSRSLAIPLGFRDFLSFFCFRSHSVAVSRAKWQKSNSSLLFFRYLMCCFFNFISSFSSQFMWRATVTRKQLETFKSTIFFLTKLQELTSWQLCRFFFDSKNLT